VLGGAHDVNVDVLQLAACRVDVINLEEWDRPVRLLAEELVYGCPGAITCTWSPSRVVNSMVVGSSKLTRRPRTSRRKPSIASYRSVRIPTDRTLRTSTRNQSRFHQPV
jgi:hypothetical protein